MTKLFDSLTLRSVTLRNRLALSPMCQYEAEDGQADLVAIGRGALRKPNFALRRSIHSITGCRRSADG